MRLASAVLIVVAAACGLAGLTSGCGSAGTNTGASSGMGGGCSSFQCSDCGKCVASSCSNDLSTCNADPECANYASCISACPVGDDGNAEPSCVDGCPKGTSTASLRAAAALLACQREGPGASCAACNVDLAAPPKNALLNQKCGGSTETNPCFKCEDEKCCDTESAGHDEPDTAAYIACIGMCNGNKDQMQTCQYQCDLGHKPGALAFQRLSACMEYYCAVDVVVPPAMTPCDESERSNCDKCQYETCGDLYADLVDTLDGVLLTDCDVACPLNDSACDQACLDMYPDADSAWFAYGGCLTGACGDVCM